MDSERSSTPTSKFTAPPGSWNGVPFRIARTSWRPVEPLLNSVVLIAASVAGSLKPGSAEMVVNREIGARGIGQHREACPPRCRRSCCISRPARESSRGSCSRRCHHRGCRSSIVAWRGIRKNIPAVVLIDVAGKAANEAIRVRIDVAQYRVDSNKYACGPGTAAEDADVEHVVPVDRNHEGVGTAGPTPAIGNRQPAGVTPLLIVSR